MFSDPEKNIEQARFSLGATIADFGSGSGHYAFALAMAVGEKGKVYAVDIQKDLLASLKRDGLKRGFSNIEVIWGDLEQERGAKLRDDAVDGVVISNLLFQVSNKEIIVGEAYRILKNGGNVLIIDWSDSFGGIGPESNAVFGKEKALELFEKKGFVFEREIQAGKHHFGIIFKKN